MEANSQMSRPVSRMSLASSAIKATSEPDYEPKASNSFFTILTGQVDHDGLKEQKSELDEIEDKLKNKLSNLMNKK